MKCFICNKKARIFCLCSNPYEVMCYDHIRNHTNGEITHRLKDIRSYQDKLFLLLVKGTVDFIINYLISTVAIKIRMENRSQIEKIPLFLEREQRKQFLQEINLEFQTILVQNQESLNYITDFKKILESMKLQINGDYIEKACTYLMKY